jgi:hypothetical protein
MSFPDQRISPAYPASRQDNPIDVRLYSPQLFPQPLDCFFFHHVSIVTDLAGKDQPYDNGEPEGRPGDMIPGISTLNFF